MEDRSFDTKFPGVRPAATRAVCDFDEGLRMDAHPLIGAAMTFVLVFAAIGIALLAGETPADQFADTCIRLDERIESVASVSCGDANDGKVLETVTDEGDCPAAATAIVTLTEDADKLLCVDDTT